MTLSVQFKLRTFMISTSDYSNDTKLCRIYFSNNCCHRRSIIRMRRLLEVIFILEGVIVNGLFCPELNETSTVAEHNMAWTCEQLNWRNALANWKHRAEQACNISAAEEYWTSVFTCPDFSEIICDNELSLDSENDMFNCSITFCKDGIYSDDTVFLDIWRQHFRTHMTIMELYKSKLIDCGKHECLESDAITIQAWNSLNERYSQLLLQVTSSEKQIEQLTLNSSVWNANVEEHSQLSKKLVEAEIQIEQFRNKSEAWDLQDQKYSALFENMENTDERVLHLENQTSVWNATKQLCYDLSYALNDANEKISQLENQIENITAENLKLQGLEAEIQGLRNSTIENLNIQANKTEELSKVSVENREDIAEIQNQRQQNQRLGSIINPASSCQEVKEWNATAADGLYYIKDFEGRVFQTYCDMNTADGGWTLVASIHENNMYGRCTTGDRWSSEQGNSAAHPHGDGFWENRATHGEATSATSDDYKNSGYFAMNASNIMIWQVPNDTPMENFTTRAFFKYHTTNGFLTLYGGNLRTLYSDHFPLRSKQFVTNTDNGPAIPIVWDIGSNDELVQLLGVNIRGEVEAGFVQFRAINHERNAFALCPGMRMTGRNVEHMCIGSTSNNLGSIEELQYCGDFAAMLYLPDPQASSDQKLISSVVMIFYK